MIAASAAIALASCTQEVEQPIENEIATVSSHIEFTAEVADPATRATLTTEDEKSFKAAWEGTDKVSLYALSDTFEETAEATWNETDKCFEGNFTKTVPTVKEDWEYEAKYPYSADGNIPFGAQRVQKGNAYNSAYDIMYGTVGYSNAVLGKDDNNNTFVIPMTRLTGIAYFHIKGGPDEDVVSATLEATGIAAETVTIASNGASVTPNTTLNSITITFEEGTAPQANNLQLWFNVLPGSYSGLKLTINTTTKTAVLNSTKELTYTAGKLNKAVLSNLNWEDNTKVYTKVTTEPTDWSGKYLIVFEGATVNNVEVAPVAFNGAAEDLTAASNGTVVTISNNTITGNSTIDAAVFEIAAITGGYSIQAINNTNFIGNTTDSNNLYEFETADVNTITLNEDKSVNIVSSGGAFLRYNATSGQYRFRYYKSSSYTGQKPVYLYLLEGSNTPDTRTEVSLNFTPAEPDAITFGDDFTEPTLTIDPVAAASAVTYSVETTPENIATIDASTGELTISANGTITVTASIASGNEAYKPASASYSLTVNAALGHGESVDDPYSIAEALTIISSLTAGNDNRTEECYVAGVVSEVISYSSSYHSITYNITADGNTSSDYLQVYSGKGLNGANFTSINDLAAGDQVVVKGQLMKFHNNTTDVDIPEIYQNSEIASIVKAPYFIASVTSNSIEYTGGNTITLNVGANVEWTATVNNGASLKIGDAAAATSVSGNSDTAVSVIIPENTAGQTYTISFSTTSTSVSAPANIQIIQTKQETLLDIPFVVGTDITSDNYGDLTYKRPIYFTIEKGTGTSYGYYSPVRFYVGNTLTIGSPFSNVTIKKVEFSLNESNPGNMTASTGTYSVSGLVGTWLGETSELVLTGSTQTRFSDFTVYYTVDGELPTLSSISIDAEPTKTEYTVGQTFDFSGASVTAHYSDNTSFMDVTSLVTTDGAAVVQTEGSQKDVTVSYTEGGITETDTFKVDVSPSTGGSTTVSMTSFSEISGNVGGDSNVTYAAAKGGASTNPAVNSNQIRIYQNGGLLTITAKNNKKLTSITIGSAMATTVTTKVDGGTESTNNSIVANGTYTINNISATEVVFKCTGTSSSSRLYLNSLSVTYE